MKPKATSLKISKLINLLARLTKEKKNINY